MRAIICSLLLLLVPVGGRAQDVYLPAQYSRFDSAWRPGINEPPLSLNKAFDSASQIQQVRPGRFPWIFENVQISGQAAKGGMLYYMYQFRFSRLIKSEPKIQREECTVTVRMDTGKVDYSDIRSQK